MRLIDADKATKILHEILDPIADKKLIWLAWDVILEDCDTIETESVRHGKWVKSDFSDFNWECSECGYGLTDNKLTYCYDCGARMDKEDTP